jgi:hypothetical protein
MEDARKLKNAEAEEPKAAVRGTRTDHLERGDEKRVDLYPSREQNKELRELVKAAGAGDALRWDNRAGSKGFYLDMGHPDAGKLNLDAFAVYRTSVAKGVDDGDAVHPEGADRRSGKTRGVTRKPAGGVRGCGLVGGGGRQEAAGRRGGGCAEGGGRQGQGGEEANVHAHRDLRGVPPRPASWRIRYCAPGMSVGAGEAAGPDPAKLSGFAKKCNRIPRLPRVISEKSAESRRTGVGQVMPGARLRGGKAPGSR